MSRKSRYVDGNNSVPYSVIWKAGVYIRLSREDEDKKDVSSQSVISQRKIIDRFLSEHNDIEVTDYFIDDGYSGTSMDRPEFQRMRNAFETGTINCIIVKDLSRFARNDEEAGRYIYVIFPFYKIRFISVNDRVDSFENPNSIYNLEIPFKNIMHSEYSRDLSKKVRSASDIRRRRGEFIGAFCSYGYKKDPENIHHLIIDEEAAEVVRFIFKRYVEVENFLKIAKELSAKNIPTPLAYKISHGQNLKLPNNQVSVTLWNVRTIKRILTNQMYLGHLIQDKRRTVSYKNKKIIETDESEWIKVENTHEPIISADLFSNVQELIKKNKRAKGVSTCKNLFAGKLFCGNCHTSMALNRSGHKTHFGYYYCKIAYLKKGVCSPKRTRYDKLGNAVLEIMNCHLKLCMDSYKLLNLIGSKKRSSFKENTSLIERNRLKIFKLQNEKSDLYGKYKEEQLSKEQYLKDKALIETKISELENDIEQLNLQESEEEDIFTQPIFSEFVKFRKFSKLTREIVDKFIDRIFVYNSTEIEVRFTFADEFSKIQDYIAHHKSEKAI